MKGGGARERIDGLLAAADDRLDRGADPADVRASYEQVLALAREAGVEPEVRPLVEVRLAALQRLAGESPPRGAPAH